MELMRQAQGAPGEIQSRFTITFTGAAGFGAAADSIVAFTVSGIAIVRKILAYPTGSLTQSGATPTLALGVVGQTGLFIVATTATLITTTNKIWTSVTPVAGGQALPAAMKDIEIMANIVLTVGGTLNINGGTLVVEAFWQPVSAGASLV